MRFGHKSIAIAAIFVLFVSVYYFFGMMIPGMHPGLEARHLAGGYGFGNDLYPIWLGSSELFHARDPYAPELRPRIETGLYGRPLDRNSPSDASVNMRAFGYPLYTAFLLAPLAGLPFPAVQVVIAIVLPVLAAFCAFWWLGVFRMRSSVAGVVAYIALALASYPVLEGIYSGQPGLLVAALIAATVAALARGRYVLAGILLPCASIKPQLVLLIALWLLLWALSAWKKRKRFVLAFFLTMCLLLLSSTLALHNWLLSWMHILREYRQISPPPLAQFVLGRVTGRLISLFLIGLSGWICWRSRRAEAKSESFLLCTVFVLATTAVVLPSTIAVYDQFLLLPAVLWLCARRHLILRGSLAVRLLALLAMGALTWQWLAACGLVMVRLVVPALAHSPRLLLLPLRTAASIPFAILALLCFVAVRELASKETAFPYALNFQKTI